MVLGQTRAAVVAEEGITAEEEEEEIVFITRQMLMQHLEVVAHLTLMPR